MYNNGPQSIKARVLKDLAFKTISRIEREKPAQPWACNLLFGRCRPTAMRKRTTRRTSTTYSLICSWDRTATCKTQHQCKPNKQEELINTTHHHSRNAGTHHGKRVQSFYGVLNALLPCFAGRKPILEFQGDQRKCCAQRQCRWCDSGHASSATTALVCHVCRIMIVNAPIQN